MSPVGIALRCIALRARSLVEAFYVAPRRRLLLRGEPVAHLLHLVVPVGAQAQPDTHRGGVHQRHGEPDPQAVEGRAALEREPDAEGDPDDIVRAAGANIKCV